MSKEFFKNKPNTTTPLNASRLNGLLNGNESMGNIVVGDVKCKNLLNINATPLTMWNSTPTINGDTLTTSGEDVRFVAYSIDVTPNTNYTLSLNSLNGKIAIYDILIETNIGETTSTQLTFNSGSHEQLAVLFYGSGTYVKPQIEEGTTSTEYTPYKGISYTSGSNENGSWIKYDDGTMIQYVAKSIPFTFTSYNKWGVMWESDLTDLGEFPIPFIDAPETLNITNYSSSGGFFESVQDTTKSRIGNAYICRSAETDGNISFHLSIIAIGKWK